MNIKKNTCFSTTRLTKSRLYDTITSISVGALAMAAGFTWASQEHVIFQKNKAFSEEEITINAGDSVRFINNDNFAHNVFSLSDVKFFDLGSFGNGGDRSVTFEDPGVAEIECAVHPDMFMIINVE